MNRPAVAARENDDGPTTADGPRSGASQLLSRSRASGAVGMAARGTMPSSRSEEVDDYHTVVAKLNDNWRIIVCTSGIQWILQRRVGERHGTPRWESRCFCRTSEALNRLSRGRAGAIDPSADATLVSLPERISTSSRLSEN
jgi:hypothetical protein